MFIELIATVFAGIAGAGLALLLNKGLGGRLPKWTAPVAAGLAMLAATISNEYSWYARTAASLPEGVEIVQTSENQAIFRPWTYIAPYVDRFATVDLVSVRTNPDAPGQRLVDMFFYGRWEAVRLHTVLVDCPASRRALVTGDVSFGEGGAVHGADWVTAEPGDMVIKTVCGGA